MCLSNRVIRNFRKASANSRKSVSPRPEPEKAKTVGRATDVVPRTDVIPYEQPETPRYQPISLNRQIFTLLHHLAKSIYHLAVVGTVLINSAGFPDYFYLYTCNST